MKTKPLLSIVAFMALATTWSRAELSWEKKEIRVEATPLEKEITVRYPFKNSGSEEVKFKSIRTGCSCVSAEVDRLTVPPGGTGEVTVKFTPEFRIGEQKRPIAIQLDDANQTKVALYLRVDIPEVIRPSPIFLKWAAEEAVTGKSVTIITDEKFPVESVRVLPMRPPIETKVSLSDDGKNYSVEVLPKRQPEPQAFYLNVEAKLRTGETKRTAVYVVIR